MQNQVQNIECSLQAACPVPCGKKERLNFLSLTEFKFESLNHICILLAETVNR